VPPDLAQAVVRVELTSINAKIMGTTP